MKKILAVSVIGAAIVGVVVVAKGAGPAATPEGKTCIKLNELCNVDDASRPTLEQCVLDLEKAKKVAGEAALKRSMKCIDESNSCAAATGCMMGGVGVGAVGQMMKGFGSALSE